MKQESRKQHIAVVFTGGTIGSRADEDGWIAPSQQQPYVLLDLFQNTYPNMAAQVEFHCSMPYQILSEQLNADYLNLLIDEVKRLIERKAYDAIFICHGTDTLQYSAAMLGLVFQDSRIPIFLVSSNYPLADARANGLDNFFYAVKSIGMYHTGVLVPYRNADGNTYLHQGIKLLAHQSFADDLYSIHQKVLGFYNKNGEWEPAATEPETAMDLTGCPEPAVSSHVPHLIQNTESILWLRMYPGFSWGQLPPETKYVILESYHSGTICIEEGLKRFASQARQAHVPVYITGLERVTDSYETIQHYDELQLQPILNVAPIALYCRLWLAVSEQ